MHHHLLVAADLDELVGELIKKVYDQRVKAGDVDAGTWKATTEEYWKAIREGWGKEPKYFSPAQITQLELRRNVNMFAAFKNHANIIELTQALTGPDGKVLSWPEFKKAANAIDGKYNVNWLKAEYNLAVNASKSAAQWMSFKEQGGMLEYKTIGDGRVREEHRKLDGTILPVEHPFWKLYYPPNGWNCRCFVRRRPADTQAVPPTELPDVRSMFRNNVGETSQIFSDEHPFIAEIGKKQSEMIRSISETETLRWERKFVTDLVKENLMGKKTSIDIDDFKATVQYTGRRLKEAVNQPHESQLDKNRAILNIEELLKTAKYFRSAVNTSAWKTQVKQYHYLITEIAGKPSYIVLEELNDGSVYFYTIVDSLKS